MKGKALFILLDPYVSGPDKGILNAVVCELKDLQSFGYFIIGITTKIFKYHLGKNGLNVIHLVLDPDKWAFPEYAWAVARRHYLNLRLSLLCSSNEAHIEWVNAAGLKRLEDPRYLLPNV